MNPNTVMLRSGHGQNWTEGDDGYTYSSERKMTYVIVIHEKQAKEKGGCQAR